MHEAEFICLITKLLQNYISNIFGKNKYHFSRMITIRKIQVSQRKICLPFEASLTIPCVNYKRGTRVTCVRELPFAIEHTYRRLSLDIFSL